MEVAGGGVFVAEVKGVSVRAEGKAGDGTTVGIGEHEVIAAMTINAVNRASSRRIGLPKCLLLSAISPIFHLIRPIPSSSFQTRYPQ